jgi:hypothetical protein
MTRSRRSSRCLIEPSDNFDLSVFGKGTPLNPKNELLLAHLRGDEDFEEQLVESHQCARALEPFQNPSQHFTLDVSGRVARLSTPSFCFLKPP